MTDEPQDPGEKKPPIIRRKTGNGGGLPHPKVPGSPEAAPRQEDPAAPPRLNIKSAGETVRIGSAPEETARIDVPGAAALDSTERIDIPAASAKEDTERIHIAAAKPASDTDRVPTEHARQMSRTDRIDLSAAKKPGDTARIDLAAGSPAKDTDRIDLAAAKKPGDTARIDAVAKPAAAGEDEEEFTAITLDPSLLKPPAEPAAEPAPKRSTDRIDLAETMPMEPVTSETPLAGGPGRREIEELMAASTVPIDALGSGKDLLSAETLPIEAVLGEGAEPQERPGGRALMNQTIRVEVDPDEIAKGDTARLDATLSPRAPVGEAPGTSRIDLSTQADAEDVLKRRAAQGTAAAAAAAAAGGKRPASAPTPPPPSGADLIEPPRSSKPGTARIAVEPPTKSATARIEVEPDDIPHAPPRPKSMKLKRAGAEGAVKKPEAPAAKPTGVAVRPDEDSFGTLAGVAALASVLVMLVLIYVLAAQTIATTLPFPGRL